MNEIEYKQGMTTIWSDGDKVIVKNPTGDKHVKANIEWVFGVGEFEKMVEVEYASEMENNRFYSMSTGYIPKKLKTDLKMKELLKKGK